MKPARVTVAALILAGLFAGSIGAGYMIGQGAFLRSTSIQAPGLPVPLPASPPASAAPSAGRVAPPDRPSGALGGSVPDTAASAGGAGASSSEAVPLPGQPAASAGSAAVSVPPALPVPPSSPGLSTGSPPAAAPGPTATPSMPLLPSRFHVQIGAFATRQNAEALAIRVKSLGYAVTLVEGPPFRVWVGGYLDWATAERLAHNLMTAGFEATLTPR